MKRAWRSRRPFRRVGKAQRAHHLSATSSLNGGHAALCPPYSFAGLTISSSPMCGPCWRIIDFDLEHRVSRLQFPAAVSAASAVSNSDLKWPSTTVTKPSVGGRSARIAFFGSGSSSEDGFFHHGPFERRAHLERDAALDRRSYDLAPEYGLMPPPKSAKPSARRMRRRTRSAHRLVARRPGVACQASRSAVSRSCAFRAG